MLNTLSPRPGLVGSLTVRAVALLIAGGVPFSPSWAAATQPAYLGEHLAYTASYEGLLSGGSRLDIADVLITTEAKATPFNGEKAYRTSLVASSEGHGALERLYPFRYEYSSLLSTDLHRSLLFEQRKGGDERHHTVVWFDWQHEQLASFKKEDRTQRASRGDPERPGRDTAARPSSADVAAPGVLAQIGVTSGAGDYEAKTIKGPAFPDLLLDRLSLLQVLRLQNFDEIGSLTIPVSDGKSLLEYRVQLVGREPLDIDGERWDTFHLRLTAFDVIKGADADQSPVEVWLAADVARTPVRFLSEQKLGRFDIRLKTAMAATAATALWPAERLAARGR